MNHKKFGKNDDAVSPVIGVIGYALQVYLGVLQNIDRKSHV